jgi:hypothetical protein
MASTVKTPAVFPAQKDPCQDVLHQACETAIAYLAKLDSAPVAATADLKTLRERLGKPLGNQGVAAEQVIADLASDAAGGIIGSAGGRFFGWVIGGAVPAAVAADWLTSAWDQNGAVYATSPAEAVVEEVVGGWLKEILHLPSHASYALVSGCQMAHVTCLAAARHAVLSERGWDLEEKGLTGAPEIRILASESRHASVARALRLLGFGRAQVVDLATDAMSRVEPAALEDALEQNAGAPIIVVLQAGEIDTGSCDLFETLIRWRRRAMPGCMWMGPSDCGPRRANNIARWCVAWRRRIRGRPTGISGSTSRTIVVLRSSRILRRIVPP